MSLGAREGQPRSSATIAMRLNALIGKGFVIRSRYFNPGNMLVAVAFLACFAVVAIPSLSTVEPIRRAGLPTYRRIGRRGNFRACRRIGSR
jgi:hypothetical protein